MDDLKKVKDLLANAEMEQALEVLKAFLVIHREELLEDWRTLSSRYYHLEREIRKDTLSYDEVSRQRSKILDTVNALIDQAGRPLTEHGLSHTDQPYAEELLLKGLKTAEKNLVERLSMLLDAHSSASEGSKKFELKKDIERTEKELQLLKEKILKVIGPS